MQKIMESIKKLVKEINLKSAPLGENEKFSAPIRLKLNSLVGGLKLFWLAVG